MIGPKLSWELRKRQFAFAICCGMPTEVVAGALGSTIHAVQACITRLLEESGMADRFEFAIQQNADVRERLYA